MWCSCLLLLLLLLLKFNVYLVYIISVQADAYAFFTGFTDIVIEGTWVEHGTSNQMTFQDWGPGEPNLGQHENCLAFFVPFDLKWVDITCSSQFNIVCERDK